MHLAMRCTKEDGVQDYLYVSVIGYGHNVGSAFTGPLANKYLIPISEIVDKPARLEERWRDDGAGGVVKIYLPIWFDAVAEGQTSMCQALIKAKGILERWLSQHQDCYPPIVINISGGPASDGNPLFPAEELRNLKSSVGNVLLYNFYLSSTLATFIKFPDREIILPEEDALLLYTMSSFLRDEQIAHANKGKKFIIMKNSRGFFYNTDPNSVFWELDILFELE
jgi:hypothetical protein